MIWFCRLFVLWLSGFPIGLFGLVWCVGGVWGLLGGVWCEFVWWCLVFSCLGFGCVRAVLFRFAEWLTFVSLNVWLHMFWFGDVLLCCLGSSGSLDFPAGLLISVRWVSARS